MTHPTDYYEIDDDKYIVLTNWEIRGETKSRKCLTISHDTSGVYRSNYIPKKLMKVVKNDEGTIIEIYVKEWFAKKLKWIK